MADQAGQLATPADSRRAATRPDTVARLRRFAYPTTAAALRAPRFSWRHH